MKRLSQMSALVLAIGAAPAYSQVLEEVVVTAQKKPESLIEAPLAVTVFDAKQLQEFSVFQADELNRLTTGLEVRYEGDTNVGVGLRGVGTFQQQSNPSRVGTYLDDYWTASQAAVALSSMFDIASVQILKGPQGTLYGQPSPGGALILNTEDPNFDGFNGNIQASYQADPQGYNVQGGLNFTLTDTLALRVAGLSDDRETGVDNVVRNKDEERGRDGGRAKLLWQPTENFSAKAGFTYTESKNSDTYRVVETLDSSIANYDVDAGDLKAIADAPSKIQKKEDYLGTLHLDWMVNDLDISFFAGYLDTHTKSETDQDNTDLPETNLFLDTDYGDDLKSYQTELRVSGNAFDRWDWSVGGYYSEAKSQTNVGTDVNRQADGGVFLLTFDIPIDSKTWAVFTHNTFDLTDDLNLIVGLRYNKFDQDSSNTIAGDFWLGSELLPGGDITDPAAVFTDVFPCPIPASPCKLTDTIDEDEVTGTVKLQYDLNESVNLYASIDRGYRPGAANFDIDGSFSPEFNSYAGETVDSFEIGVKGDLMDGRARYTAAVFYGRYDDYQVPVNFEAYNTVTGDVQVITNAPFVNVDEAEQKGVEADFRMLVTDAWMVYAAFTYAEVEFTDGTVPCTDPSQPPIGPPPANRYNTCDANGENATAMPKWTGMLQTEYTWDQVVMDSDYYVSALWSYKGDTKGVGDVAGRLDGDSFSVVDVFTGLRNDVWSAQLYVKNAFDDDGVLNRRPLNTLAYNELTVTPPRSVGITGTYRF